ncbi:MULTISPECIES: bifunctional (p)ppGpp synthetase/guanosine-3',5'-bis(diphosphate) 3'-pyrophosphohydrolase [Ensifer]|jgi:guanosine-3',5'-bis(diphosphate) 3'-pyrophosphohydrolase|uniref:GTP pyrophosphokinase rsh n=1 Tax=Ensifer adhaerens TaxID=106592 RepID=A0ABY8HJ93_ENSAD|nr:MULTISPECIES: bifunctional (p)ppGpp synthetase/guanosine-3',5'-bis(diphosphate) 3'-pyrophosphohydrolase [Ensifer]KSV73374.1 GTP pyrophosphokinase [Sinorhizobium sp. GW3]KSV81418.1 GTP pyrophosphokinase [Sinorhizobium sp. GL2]OWZ93365.1 bifunctional (p)ppGpp synthetase/guanosine-3',5'-bis(diphosphate) 3'-pyrophosphohydrolase [Sinorhizobium sp. LM21]ANK71861.1 GTP pyrophosphokinase [Ensifer adhaerens]KDP71125.1 GTP pyrophosphokinase [Ensifer adhaerens]
MMRQYELVERVQKYKPDVNEALLNKAYVYAMQKHGQQKRASGDPYISHPLEVAAILTEMRLDESTIAVALLHDTIEDTTATRQEIDDLFGEDIGALVEGLTKIKKLDLVTKKAKQAENLRKLLLAISDDVRVLLVKLADRLHNMRTLDHMSAEKRARISEETMDIYAPLAGRMGMQDMREELENLSFRHINPEAFETVTRRLEELSERNEGLIKKIEDELRELLQAEGLKAAQVKGRQKKPYSVFRKMQSKSLSFEQLSDVWGFRIIVDDIPSCYRALGIVHTRWRVVPGRFKDYISTPKQNDYQSIHTTIVGPSRQRIELQIRTRRMNDIAEYGIAAHSLYKDREGKEGASADAALSPTSNAYSWLRRTIESLAEGDNPEEFLEHTKLELFQDQVFCFTPKGQLIALPRGATPIDFAYAVHTNIGDTCVGAKINGRIMPLVTRLNNGDEVEIIRSGIQVPPPAWEEIVVTGKARSAIRRATRAAIRKQYAGLGYRILERTFERAGKSFSREALKPALHRLGQKEVEDAIASVGRGELSSLDVLRAVFPDHQDERVTVKPSADDGWFNMRSAAGMVFKLPGRGKDANGVAQVEGPEALPIRGLSGNAEVHFSPAGAIPGDRIVGIMEKDKGITIYPIQSPILQKFDDEPERWIDVRWDLDEANSSRFIARIAISALNEPGTLAEVAQAIATSDVNIRTLSMGRVAADFSELQFDLEVWDLRQLNHLITQLKELPSVSMVKRLFE